MNAGVIIIYCCGIYSLAFAIFHVLFWRLFDWKNDLRKVSVANKAIIQIANSRLIYFFLFTAFLCFVYTGELQQTKLGKVFMAGLSVFWLGRIVEQFIFLGTKNRFVNILTVLFFIGMILFALPLIISAFA